MILAPAADWRYSFKRGMVGTDVAALQINVGATVDGDFGAQTERLVSDMQRADGLLVDGIAGPVTQRHIVRKACGPVQKELRLPSGILLSISNNESAAFLAAYSPHADDPGYDLGAFQRNLQGPTQDSIAKAYDAALQARLVGDSLRHLHDKYAAPKPGWYLDNVASGRGGRLAWQLAILNHNWPEAAEQIWRTGSVPDENEERAWIVDASAGRLRTKREWIVSYIERATVYVNWTD